MSKTLQRIVNRKSPHKTAEQFRAEVRPTLINYEEEFLAYDGEGAYRLIKDGTVASEVQRHFEGAVEMLPTNTRGDKKAFPCNPKTNDVNEVVGALERQNHVAPGTISPPFFLSGEYDWSMIDALNVISCRNGLLDITTRTRYDSTPQFFTRTALPIEYDADASPVRWLTFLDEVLGGDVELILLLQQMFGYLITSDTSYQKIFYFRGVSNSGKSTIMRVLDALIGERNICNPTIFDLADKNTLNDMTACTLAKITDMNTDVKQDVSKAASSMNAISGEDPVHVFRKFKDGINVRMKVRFLLSGNQFPNFGEHATALKRRLLVIPFNISFADRADPDLSAKLIAELPGILNWALDGLASLRDARRFIEPDASLRAKEEIMNSGDPLRSFVYEECELGFDFQVSKDELFRRYQLHCQTIGAKMPLAKPKFIAALKTAFNGVRPARLGGDGGREQAMVGIRLKAGAERVPTITYRLDPNMLDLFERTDPEAIMRDAAGRPVEHSGTADFDG
jgi:putative DNA primase/helicase